MLFKLSRVTEGEAADTALIRSLSGMLALMPVQVCGLDECLLTHWTHVGPVSAVDAFMFVQISRLVERLFASLTLERHLASMNALVVPQRILRRHHFATEATAERQLHCTLLVQEQRAGGTALTNSHAGCVRSKRRTNSLWILKKAISKDVSRYYN